MTTIKQIQSAVVGALGKYGGLLAAGAAGAAIGGSVGALAASKIGSSKARKRRSTKIKSKRKRSSKSGGSRKRRTPHTAGKRKDTSRRRIRYTKNGQPYVIMASGKAKFIKKKGAKSSHKKKGGRY